MTTKTKIPILITLGWSKALLYVDHLDQIAFLQSAVSVDSSWDGDKTVIYPTKDGYKNLTVELVNATILAEKPEPKPTEPEPKPEFVKGSITDPEAVAAFEEGLPI